MEPDESVHIIVYRIQIRETIKILIDANANLDRTETIVPHELYYNVTAVKVQSIEMVHIYRIAVSMASLTTRMKISLKMFSTIFAGVWFSSQKGSTK